MTVPISAIHAAFWDITLVLETRHAVKQLEEKTKEGSTLTSKQVESLVRLRDAFSMASEALNDYITTLAPAEVRNEKNTTAAVNELNFSTLKFDAQQGSKLGSFEVAHKAGNIAEKWQTAYNILNSSNATIKDRYHGQGYQFSYWLYGSDKIYRQKLMEKQGEKPSATST